MFYNLKKIAEGLVYERETEENGDFLSTTMQQALRKYCNSCDGVIFSRLLFLYTLYLYIQLLLYRASEKFNDK